MLGKASSQIDGRWLASPSSAARFALAFCSGPVDGSELLTECQYLGLACCCRTACYRVLPVSLT